MALKFDELNQSSREIYEEWFGIMPLTDEQLNTRIDMAEEIEQFMVTALTFMYADLKLQDSIDEDFYTEYISERLENVIGEYEGSIDNDNYLKMYAVEMASVIVANTVKHKDSDYYFSQKRAIDIAKNQSNFGANYGEEIEAISNGFTKKTWMSQHDSKVRDTHFEAHGQTVGIFEPFHVGDSELMFPMDTSLNAQVKEINGCRCTVEYSK